MDADGGIVLLRFQRTRGRTRDVGGARARGRGRHRPPGGHRVMSLAISWERRLAVDEHEQMGEDAVRTPRQKCDHLGRYVDMGAQAEHGA